MHHSLRVFAGETDIVAQLENTWSTLRIAKSVNCIALPLREDSKMLLFWNAILRSTDTVGTFNHSLLPQRIVAHAF